MTYRIVYTCPDENCLVVVSPPEDGTVSQQDVIESAGIPEGVPYTIIDETEFPPDRYFRDQWTEEGDLVVSEPLEACKEKCHERRRCCREEEFKPHDEVIMKQIPGSTAEEAEHCRCEIREKYATIQEHIDACTDTAQLRQVVTEEMGEDVTIGMYKGDISS